MPSEEVTLGIIGSVNIAILTLITLYRTIRFMASCTYEELKTYTYSKKLIFHIFLFLASACDLPYYIGLATTGEFSLISYSFHRFETAFLFAAFSITISDWGAVLYDIKEFRLSALVLRRVTLITLNAIYLFISLANFILCFTLENMDTYLNSPLYIASIFFQISVSFLLCAFMLHAGLKLSWRIQGAAGNMAGNNTLEGNARGAYTRFTQRIRQVSTSSVLYRPQEVNVEFRSALRNLNIVMGTCSACIALQITMLTLNYALGYAKSSSSTVGPPIFYWTCYYWIPMWGVILPLLYLSRAHTPRKTFRAEVPKSYIPNHSTNAFIGGEDELEYDYNDHVHSLSGASRRGGILSHDDPDGDESSLSAALLSDLEAESSNGSAGQYLRDSYAIRPQSRDDHSVTSATSVDTAERQMSQYQDTHNVPAHINRLFNAAGNNNSNSNSNTNSFNNNNSSQNSNIRNNTSSPFATTTNNNNDDSLPFTPQSELTYRDSVASSVLSPMVPHHDMYIKGGPLSMMRSESEDGMDG